MLKTITSLILLSVFLASPSVHATLIQYNETTDGDLSNTYFAAVNSGDTLEITGSVSQQVAGKGYDSDVFTVTLLDNWLVNTIFTTEDGATAIVDFISAPFGVKVVNSGEYLNYASGVAGTYSFQPVPQANTGTINYTYSFVVGNQIAQVPAPATILLLGLGLVAMGSTKKRKPN